VIARKMPATSERLNITYGPNTIERFRRAGGYASRILTGEKAADLPVQAPTKYGEAARHRRAGDAARVCRRGDRVSAQPLRNFAAPAHGSVCWHNSEVAARLGHVGFGGISGLDMLSLSSSGCDPGCVKTHFLARRQK
jgi:hypothetical protein